MTYDENDPTASPREAQNRAARITTEAQQRERNGVRSYLVRVQSDPDVRVIYDFDPSKDAWRREAQLRMQGEWRVQSRSSGEQARRAAELDGVMRHDQKRSNSP